MPVTIAIETPLQDDVRGLVAKLNDHLLPLSPLEFQFKMTMEQMADSDTTLFLARDEAGKAIGMGALKLHASTLGEVKRMFTDPAVRGQRVGSALLDAIVGLARQRNLASLMLETGSGDGMAEAHRLYTRSGFVARGPFLDYPNSEWSAFFEMPLNVEQPACAISTTSRDDGDDRHLRAAQAGDQSWHDPISPLRQSERDSR